MIKREERDALLAVLRKHLPDGRWPDGRALEDVVISPGVAP